MPVVNVNDDVDNDASVLSECVSAIPTVELGCEFRTTSNVSVLPASVTEVDPAVSVIVILAASSSIIVIFVVFDPKALYLESDPVNDQTSGTTTLPFCIKSFIPVTVILFVPQSVFVKVTLLAEVDSRVGLGCCITR